MVKWLDDKTKTNVAIMKDAQGKTPWVGTIHPKGKPPYMRTHADDDWNDNLLALDTY